MKTRLVILLILLGLWTSSAVLSQSTFVFSNGYQQVNAPVYDAFGVPLEGPGYLAELWGGVTADSLSPAVGSGGRQIVPFLGCYRITPHFVEDPGLAVTAQATGHHLFIRASQTRVPGPHLQSDQASIGVPPCLRPIQNGPPTRLNCVSTHELYVAYAGQGTAPGDRADVFSGLPARRRGSEPARPR
jgi:hypothetical protein